MVRTYPGAHHVEPLADTTAGGDSTSSGSDTKVSEDRGNQTAENIRYGQKLSEDGMGGKTTGQQGEANQGMRLLIPVRVAGPAAA